MVLPPALAAGRGGLFELSPFAGINRFDANISDSAGPALGLRGGYYLTKEWEAELSLLQAWSDKASGKVTLGHASLGALYHPPFIATENLSPYLGAGAGPAYYDYDTTARTGFEREWAVHYCAGVKYSLNENLALQGDLREIITHGPARRNLLATLGVAWTFGEAPPPLPAETAAPQPPAKVEEKITEAPKAPQPTPAAVKPEAPDGDGDGDGVPDSLDKCPGTPKGVKVGRDGCPQKEEAAAPASAPAPAKPAPAPAKEPEAQPPAKVEKTTPQPAPVAPTAQEPAKKPVRIETTLRFGLNSAKMKKEYRSEVEKLAKFLKENPAAVITLEGHADSTGDDDYNLKLSERRARALSKILVKTYGIEAGRITTAGLGETRPAAPNNTAKGRAKNRRVEAVITAP